MPTHERPNGLGSVGRVNAETMTNADEDHPMQPRNINELQRAIEDGQEAFECPACRYMIRDEFDHEPGCANSGWDNSDVIDHIKRQSSIYSHK